VGNALDSPRPKGLVELWVDPYISSAHLPLGKGDDGFHCGGSTLLERTAVHKFVKVYGIFACHHVLKCGPCFSLYDDGGERCCAEYNNNQNPSTLVFFLIPPV
jgi:hypothetical protein